MYLGVPRSKGDLDPEPLCEWALREHFGSSLPPLMIGLGEACVTPEPHEFPDLFLWLRQIHCAPADSHRPQSLSIIKKGIQRIFYP